MMVGKRAQGVVEVGPDGAVDTIDQVLNLAIEVEFLDDRQFIPSVDRVIVVERAIVVSQRSTGVIVLGQGIAAPRQYQDHEYGFCPTHG